MPDSEIVRLSTIVVEHERRLNAMEDHLAVIEHSVTGIREDFNEHAQEMISKVAAFALALKIAGGIATAVMVAIIGLLIKLVETHP